MSGSSPLRDAAGLYAGPVVDPHHHLWDLALGRHPWLRRAAESGEESPLTRNQFAADYLAAAAGHNVVATVHVETGWEARDPFDEVAWLDSIDKPDGIALRYVAHADLGAPDVEAVLARHAAHGRIVGIRDILSSFDQTYIAFKTIVAAFSDEECSALFEGNARRIYRLPTR